MISDVNFSSKTPPWTWRSIVARPAVRTKGLTNLESRGVPRWLVISFAWFSSTPLEMSISVEMSLERGSMEITLKASELTLESLLRVPMSHWSKIPSCFTFDPFGQVVAIISIGCWCDGCTHSEFSWLVVSWISESLDAAVGSPVTKLSS